VEKEEEERTRWTLTLNDATLRASFPCFPLFSLVFPLFLISILSDGPCLGSILSDGPQLVSHGRRNPGLLRYSLCGPGRPAARESSRNPDQRLRCTDGEHSPGPRTQRPTPRQLRAGDTPSPTTPPESEAQPYAPLPHRRPRRASRSMFAKPPTGVCLSKTGDPCAAPATHPRMDEDPACPVAKSIKATRDNDSVASASAGARSFGFS
jgi:hypothetical protein